MPKSQTRLSKNITSLNEAYKKLTDDADYNGALVIFQQIPLADFPYNKRIDVLYGIARCQKGLKQYNSAIATIESALKYPGRE